VTTSNPADKATQINSSQPDLASLDAAWEDEPENAEGDDDAGWEPVLPDPKGGPPQRQHLSRKERSRQKREKQRLKADSAAQKQKKKKPRTRDKDEGEAEDEERAPETSTAKSAETRKPRSARIKKKTFDLRTIAMIAAALAVAGVALYFMLTSGR
jgi:hypothetical protein